LVSVKAPAERKEMPYTSRKRLRQQKQGEVVGWVVGVAWFLVMEAVLSKLFHLDGWWTTHNDLKFLFDFLLITVVTLFTLGVSAYVGCWFAWAVASRR
jgi:hypothetical protein